MFNTDSNTRSQRKYLIAGHMILLYLPSYCSTTDERTSHSAAEQNHYYEMYVQIPYRVPARCKSTPCFRWRKIAYVSESIRLLITLDNVWKSDRAVGEKPRSPNHWVITEPSYSRYGTDTTLVFNCRLFWPRLLISLWPKQKICKFYFKTHVYFWIVQNYMFMQ